MGYDTGPGIGICINKATVLTHDESLKGLAKRQNGTTKKYLLNKNSRLRNISPSLKIIKNLLIFLLTVFNLRV